MLLTVRREGKTERGESGRQRASEGGGDNWIISTIEWWGARGAANGGRDVLFSEANCSEKSWAFVQGGPATFPVHLQEHCLAECTDTHTHTHTHRQTHALWRHFGMWGTFRSAYTHKEICGDPVSTKHLISAGVHSASGTFRRQPLQIELQLSCQTVATRTPLFYCLTVCSLFTLCVSITLLCACLSACKWVTDWWHAKCRPFKRHTKPITSYCIVTVQPHLTFYGHEKKKQRRKTPNFSVRSNSLSLLGGRQYETQISLDSCMDCSKLNNLSVNSVKSSRCNGYFWGL